jgi:prepilin-type N-terminal cleavage/methylation domain-containing protein
MNISKKINSLRNPRGFTLLELLIVISIIAVLSVALVLVLNPAETLKKARDSQRIADLNTLKTALGIYVTSTTTPLLGGNATNATCKATPATTFGTTGTYKIWYSTASTSPVTDTTLDTGTTVTNAAHSLTAAGLTDGNGWIPINLDSLVGGSPISNLPVDPVNAIVVGASTLASVTSEALAYRYACAVSPLTFEIDAQLESNAYTVADDKRASDGGNNASFYEVGTNLQILGSGSF